MKCRVGVRGGDVMTGDYTTDNRNNASFLNKVNRVQGQRHCDTTIVGGIGKLDPLAFVIAGICAVEVGEF
jgi:hypothetical protein